MSDLEKSNTELNTVRGALKQAVGFAGITLAMSVPAIGATTDGVTAERDVAQIIRQAQEQTSEASGNVEQKLAQWNNWANWNNY